MGDIYSTAETVYVWLGDETTRTDRAMAHLATDYLQQDLLPMEQGNLGARLYAMLRFYVWTRWSRIFPSLPHGGTKSFCLAVVRSVILSLC
jgi:hypothetical protein